MKKEDVSGLFVYLVILVIAVVFGITILREHSTYSELSGAAYFGFIFGAIVVGVIFNAIVFELGHLLGAKIGRYEVISCCILGFTFYKQEGKRKFKFGNFDGLTGETKIIPAKNAKKESNPTSFLWLGTLFYIIELAIVITLFIILTHGEGQKHNDPAYFLLVIGVLGGLILFYNIIPIKLDSVTDGYRLTLVSNPRNKEAFNELLRVEYEIENGNTDVEIKTFETITNFTADLNLNKVYVLLEKKQYAEAEELLNVIVENKKNISQYVYIRARAQLIYIAIMTKSFEEAKDYFEKNVTHDEQKEIFRDTSMVCIRTYILMEGLFDKSKSECILALEQVMKAFKHTPKQRQKVEIVLFNDALQKIIELHPDWHFEDYLLEERSNSKEEPKA